MAYSLDRFEHQWTFPRKFHVSPFNDRKGYYRIAVTPPPLSPSVATRNLGDNLEHFTRMKIRIHYLVARSGEPNTGPTNNVEIKLMASMRAASVVPWSSSAILRALTKYPFALFLSLPRISWHAFILHYKKLLPIFPRPDPFPVAFAEHDSHSQPESYHGSRGLGWQPTSSPEKFAQERVEHFLHRRTTEAHISVTLISGDPAVPECHFSARTENAAAETKDQLTISYLSSAFFTALLECPSARHALLLGRTSTPPLFTVSSTILFLRLFGRETKAQVRTAPRATKPSPSDKEGTPAHDPQLSLAQRLRVHALPSQIRIRTHPQLPIPAEHPIDPSTHESFSAALTYARVLAFLLGRAWNARFERWLYTLSRVRFAEGQEPWSQWQRLSERIAADSESILIDMRE